MNVRSGFVLSEQGQERLANAYWCSNEFFSFLLGVCLAELPSDSQRALFFTE